MNNKEERKPRGSAKHELILLFEKLHFTPRKLFEWLTERGIKEYSYSTILKYHSHFRLANAIYDQIIEKEKVKK